MWKEPEAKQEAVNYIKRDSWERVLTFTDQLDIQIPF